MFSVIVVGGIILAGYLWFIAQAKRANRVPLPETGIVFIDGRPGSGKSYYAVLQLLEAITVHRRPVYTNLPLKWRVVRCYLRTHGGPNLARLVRPLERSHLDAFFKRASLRQRHIEAVEHERAAIAVELCTASPDRSDVLSRRLVELQPGAVERSFVEKHGPDVFDGPAANAIPPYSVVILDEAQHWYPGGGINGKGKNESPELMTYMTMHRHYGHLWYVLTQKPSNVTHTIRSLATKLIKVRDAARDKITFGLSMGSFGVRAFGYAVYAPDPSAENVADNTEPLSQGLLFPWMPSKRWVFRLYRSFTHAGSPRAQRRLLQRARISSGLTADGADPQAMKPIPKSVSGKLFGAATFVAGVLVTASVMSSEVREPLPSTWSPNETVSSISTSAVRVGSRSLRLGASYDGYALVAIDPGRSYAIFSGPGGLFAWGKGGPPRLVRRNTAAAAVDPRLSEPAATTAGGGSRPHR